jgi:hypothetical protein
VGISGGGSSALVTGRLGAAAGARTGSPLPVLLAVLPLLILWAWALADVARTDPAAVRTLTQQQCLWVVALTSVFGAVLSLGLGRPRP